MYRLLKINPSGSLWENGVIRWFFFFIFLLFPIISNAIIVDKENNFLVISDIHLDQASRHPMDISPLKIDRNNDLDSLTFEKLIFEIDNNIKNGIVAQPNFILILGDIVGHKRSSSDSALESEATVFKVLKDTFPYTPIFYTFGNNDSLTINYGPFKGSDGNPYDIAKYAGGWANGFLSTGTTCEDKKNNFPCMITEDTTNGYYSAYLESNLRLISLNSVLFSPNRTQTIEQDAMNQLQWLDAQLETARMNQEGVLIVMHVPPGNNIYNHSNFWLPKEQAVFLKIVSTYQHTIIGILASHTHTEELRVIKDVSKNDIAGIYLVAGLSTSHGNEPAVKTFYFFKEDNQWLLANYEAFHFSLDNSNLIFSKLYDYLSYYCNGQEDRLFQCLGNVTADKMDKYFAAGNKNYTGGMMRSSENIILTVPE